MFQWQADKINQDSDLLKYDIHVVFVRKVHIYSLEYI